MFVYASMKSVPKEEKSLLKPQTEKKNGWQKCFFNLTALLALIAVIVIVFTIISCLTNVWKKRGADQVKWIPGTHGFFPQEGHPVIVTSGNDTFVVIRAEYNGGLIPGRLIPGQPYASIGANDVETYVYNYEVLVDPAGALCWTESNKKEFKETMKNAVYGGHADADNDPESMLAICRAKVHGVLTPGKQDGEGGCYIPVRGMEEYEEDDCETLIYC